jgi:hypothetical protein
VFDFFTPSLPWGEGGPSVALASAFLLDAETLGYWITPTCLAELDTGLTPGNPKSEIQDPKLQCPSIFLLDKHAAENG